MKIKPLKNYREPQYPTREQFMQNPTALNNYFPAKWKSCKFLTTAMTVFLLGNTNPSKKELPKEKCSIEKDCFPNEFPNRNEVSDENNIPLVAPIFIHGEGRGAFGCVMINPPAYLTEEEARQVIETELLKEGIIFDVKNYKLDDVAFSSYPDYLEEDSESIRNSRKIHKDSVNLDGYCTKLNLGYEFISVEEYDKFGATGSNYGSSIEDFNLVQSAENLREKVKDNGKMNLVVFYDPIEEEEFERSSRSFKSIVDRPLSDDEFKKELITPYEKDINSKSINSLKKQVADFIDWIKTEGLLTKDK